MVEGEQSIVHGMKVIRSEIRRRGIREAKLEKRKTGMEARRDGVASIPPLRGPTRQKSA
jgi:hypothetical protein